jgi:hypothetical protein
MRISNWLCDLKILPLLLLLPLFSQAQQTVFFFGNYVDIQDKQAFHAHLDNLFQQQQHGFSLLLAGDLASGKMDKNSGEEALKPIFDLLDLMQKYPKGQLLFLAGDRDWNSGKKGGEKSVQALEAQVKDYYKDKNYTNIHWLADDACPGPDLYKVDNSLIIIGLNTQWWNHRFDKPRSSDGFCGALNDENLQEELDDIVSDNLDKNILIIGHHPIYSLGNYGGFFSFWQQLWPLPVVGSFRTAFHANAGNSKDLANGRLQGYAELLKNLLFFHENIIYAAGHEKNQQAIRYGKNYLLNSGAPAAAAFTAKDDSTLFSASKAGIMELDYGKDGKVTLRFHQFSKEKGFEEKENHLLYEPACGHAGKSSSIPDNTAYIPCKETADIPNKMAHKYPDPITTAAGKEYQANGWKKLWLGEHYRSSWTEPVRVPYLDLDKTHGGLVPYEKGGGRQTTSLKFKSADGTAYTFRSVNKDPAKSLNYRLRPTVLASVLRDQTSTQQPYGAIAVAPLLGKINILHATPALYVLPDDPKLGPFQAQYGGLLGMLEVNPGKENDQGQLFGEADEIMQSSELFREFYKNQKLKVDRQEFIRARLFDILVGDWSKHEDNWKWALYKQGDFTVARPIPRDRDHVFSRQDGVLPWIADRRFVFKAIENFGYKIHDLQSLTYQAQHLDRFLTTEATKADFLEQAAYIQAHITVAEIDAAVRNMPPEVLEKSGLEIAAKLKARLQDLPKYAEEYYRLLSRKVDVVGSNEKEYFLVNRMEDGAVEVIIQDIKDGKKGSKVLYHRIFHPQETKELYLWALGGDDVFEIAGNGPGQIELRAFGGPGDDVFKDSAEAKTWLYDKGKGTKYELRGGAQKVEYWNKEIYEYDRLKYEPDLLFPTPYIFYDKFSGLGFSLPVTFTSRRFDKDNYASKHSFGLSLTAQRNFSLAYKGRFHQTIHHWDTELNALYAKPDFYNYFYGLGGLSTKDDEPRTHGYYDAKVNRANISLGMVRDFWQKSSFQLHAGLEQSQSDLLPGTYLAEHADEVFGASQKFTLLPFTALFDLDFRDSKGLPYRGIRAFLNYHYGRFVSGHDGGYGVFDGSLEYYLSSRSRHPITFGLRLGAADSHGDVPWYDLPTLGDYNGLRGYFHHRFTGKSKTYAQTELRFQFLEKETVLVPIKAGMKIFFDYGRLLGNEESNSEWRQGYGLGFYLVPLEGNFTVSLSVGFSDEERFYPTFGIGTPLR